MVVVMCVVLCLHVLCCESWLYIYDNGDGAGDGCAESGLTWLSYVLLWHGGQQCDDGVGCAVFSCCAATW